MKKGIVSACAMLFLCSSLAIAADNSLSWLTQLVLPQSDIQNVIDWRVGDYANYDLDLGFFNGKINKTVPKDEGTAVWMKIIAKTGMGSQTIETLVRKTDGKVLKIIIDGKEQSNAQHDIEIIEKKADTITVPAGTFQTIYIKVKDKTEDAEIESWINPVKIPLDGSAKTTIKKGFVNATMVLTDFGYTKRD